MGGGGCVFKTMRVKISRRERRQSRLLREHQVPIRADRRGGAHEEMEKKFSRRQRFTVISASSVSKCSVRYDLKSIQWI